MFQMSVLHVILMTNVYAVTHRSMGMVLSKRAIYNYHTNIGVNSKLPTDLVPIEHNVC